MDAVKNQNYGLCWPIQLDLLSLKEYSTNCLNCCLKAKFHYASWFEAGSKLFGDQLRTS